MDRYQKESGFLIPKLRLHNLSCRSQMETIQKGISGFARYLSVGLIMDVLKPSEKHVKTKQNKSHLYYKNFIHEVSIDNSKPRKYQCCVLLVLWHLGNQFKAMCCKQFFHSFITWGCKMFTGSNCSIAANTESSMYY